MDQVLTITDANFEQEVIKSDIPVLVDFWAEWCAPCRAIAPIVEELAKEYKGKVKFGKMNVDENQNTPSNFSIMSIPTLIIFKNGQPVNTLIGVQSKDNFKKALDEALG